MATYQRDYNPRLFEAVSGIVKRCPVTPIEHEKLMLMGKHAKVIVRTGNFNPWGNVALVAGVKAPVWFSKPGVVAPDFYTERVKYVDNDYPEK